MEVKKAVQSGNVQEAIEKINDLNPTDTKKPWMLSFRARRCPGSLLPLSSFPMAGGWRGGRLLLHALTGSSMRWAGGVRKVGAPDAMRFEWDREALAQDSAPGRRSPRTRLTFRLQEILTQ